MKTRIVPVQNIARLKVAAQALNHRAHGVPGMGVVEGEPGLGKTTAITWLVNKEHGIYVRAMESWTPAAMLGTILLEVDRAPRGSCFQMTQDLIQRLGETGRSLYIDEADYLLKKTSLLNITRDLHDMANVPVVLIGMKKFVQKIAHLEQLASRVMQTVRFEAYDLGDTAMLAEQLCEVAVKPDLVARVHQLSHGSARRIIVLLSDIEQHARALKLTEIGLAEYKKGAEVLAGAGN